MIEVYNFSGEAKALSDLTIPAGGPFMVPDSYALTAGDSALVVKTVGTWTAEPDFAFHAGFTPAESTQLLAFLCGAVLFAVVQRAFRV